MKVLLKFWNELDRAGGEVKACDNAFVDIVDDWQPVMNIIFEICEVYKVPGRKAKSYDQIIIRTMFFERCSDTGIFIVDGIKYEVSNAANIDHFNCKQAICFLWGT